MFLNSSCQAENLYNTPIRIYTGSPVNPGKMMLKLKPVLREMVRTGVLVPKVTLLVDKIIIARVPTSPDSTPMEAYRMYLTDGEKSIQGKQICDHDSH